MSRLYSVPSGKLDFSRRIQNIVAVTECDHHNAPEGIPCFQLRMDSRDGFYWAICSTRASRFNKEKQ